MKPISTNLVYRHEFIKLILLGALLALGVSVLASVVSIALREYVSIGIVTGVAIILISLPVLYAAQVATSARKASKTIQAVATFDPGETDTIDIDRYSFSESLSRVFTAVTKENPAFHDILSRELFPDTKNPDENESDNGTAPAKIPESDADDHGEDCLAIVRVESDGAAPRMPRPDFFIEILEFLLLHELSMHLSSYFEERGSDTPKTLQLTREHIPEVVLSNRVFALLTTPIEERPIFRKSSIHKNPPNGTIHSLWGKSGVVFERFDITLPAGSTLDRPKKGVITVRTKRGELRISVRCDGFTANLPRGFESLYLGREIDDRVTSLQVEIDVESQLYRSALLTRKGWEYYRWMDSFADHLEKKADFFGFCTSIGWEHALTQHIIRMKVPQHRARATRRASRNTDGDTPSQAEQAD